MLELKLDDSPTEGLGIFLIVHSRGDGHRVEKTRQASRQHEPLASNGNDTSVLACEQ
jgi:hypothetical protein